jgi:hypothetical protein
MKFREYININYLSETAEPPKMHKWVKKAVEELKKKGFKIVMWDADFIGMMDKKKNPAEVYPDGTIKYPKRLV